MSETPAKPNRSKWIVGVIVAAMAGVTGISLTTNLFGTDLSRRLQQISPQSQGSLEKLEIVSGDKTHVFQVEVMKTPEQRAKGLMFREYMPEERGMLFDFEREEPVAMWMRNTKIPLDMVFIRANGVVLRIHERAQPMDETTIPAGGLVRYVLELNGGIAAKLGLKAGDRVKHNLIR
jgi:uncharacterized protein